MIPPRPNLSKRYIGRFAPSPTGPLHFGSLVAAVGSYLQAKAHQGQWLVRMEDLDPPREVPGAAKAILHTLERFGLHWDGSVLYQSRRNEAYREALEKLRATGLLYACGCSRKQISQISERGPFGPVYPGLCRSANRREQSRAALRIRVDDQLIEFCDAIHGNYGQRLESEVGDFVVRRADGLFAYQLAVVVDDAEQGVTEVVRGADLLASAPRQIYLQRLLGYSHPAYVHLPLALNAVGQKLSKQNGAQAVGDERPHLTLLRVLDFLNQSPPPELYEAKLDEIWQWAITHWDLHPIPARDKPLDLSRP